MCLSAAQIKTLRKDDKHSFGVLANVQLSCSSVQGQRGFTLVELITIMMIVGILAVAVIPRFFEVSTFERRGSADQVKSMLRFAQKTAVAQRRNVSVAISGSADESNCTTTLSGGNLNCVVKSTMTGAGTYTFNALGQLTAPAPPVIVGGATTITIEQETGYVH